MCSWYESDPPPSLQWLHETDWGYVLNISKRCAGKEIPLRHFNPLTYWGMAVKLKRNLLAIWVTLVLVLSIALPVSKVTWLLLARSGQAENLVIELSSECLLAGMSLQMHVLSYF